jgi:hypothetical protein
MAGKLFDALGTSVIPQDSRSYFSAEIFPSVSGPDFLFQALLVCARQRFDTGDIDAD